jgi:hypothetical protein
VNRRLTAVAASAITAATMLAFSPAAQAAGKAPIRAYTEHATISFTSVGSRAGFSSTFTEAERVILSPRLAAASNWSDVFHLKVPHVSSGQAVIIGNRLYTRTGNGRWGVKLLTTRQLANYAAKGTPYVALAKFDALRGIRLVAPRHYLVSGAYAQIGSFLAWEFGLNAGSFAGTGITTFRVQFWLDASGRPVFIGATARSSTTEFAVAEVFANYNKPVVIKVP